MLLHLRPRGQESVEGGEFEGVFDAHLNVAVYNQAGGTLALPAGLGAAENIIKLSCLSTALCVLLETSRFFESRDSRRRV